MLEPFDIKYDVKCDADPDEAVSFATDIDTAKKTCMANPECLMFYDECGEGQNFKMCSNPGREAKSTCENSNREGRDVLYIKGNNEN